MFTPSSFPCVAWRINQRSLPVPIIVDEPYVGMYHTDPDLYLCEGGWLLHASELFESCLKAQLHCQADVEVAA